MPTYVTLGNWTDQGVRNAKETVKRYEAAEATAKQMGATFKSFFWTMGAYDLVGIVEAPDDATASRVLLAIGMAGNVRTVTMRGHTKEEMAQILKGLP